MSEDKEKKKEKLHDEVDEVKEVFGVLSTEIPSLIKGIMNSVFSEEAGKDMGKAAAAFYKQLKEAGMPEETAVRMTENYISVFTNLGNIMKKVNIKGDVGDEISRKIKEKLAEKHIEEDED
jgi:hypothetical protein